jgi:TonB family protein
LGRRAKCIAFDTLTNGVMQNNEICVDTERGVVLRWRVGDEYIENTEFFRVGNLYEPAHIRRYLRHQLQMEIDQQMKLIDGPVDPNVFTPPSAEWKTLSPCSTSRRPVAVFTPQPAPGKNGHEIVDVLVHGSIHPDGKVYGAVVDASPDPKLNAEALQLISTWKFLPLICDETPLSLSTDFVLHFQGR